MNIPSSCLAAFFVLASVLQALLTHAQAQVREVPGLMGTTQIPFTMPIDGTATLAIYNKEGQQIRTLAQNAPLTKGQYIARWDGMDHWGNLVPAGTETTVKVFTGPGLRAIWEFAIASPNPVPWPTRSHGEGDAMRAGGWLGDHGVSSSAVAVGDRLYFGSTMAEHGHTVIFTNLEGEKMWGRGGLDGWAGPEILTSDGEAVYGAVKGRLLYRLELDGSKSAKIAETGKNKILGLAAHDGKVFLTLSNYEASASLIASSPNNSKNFDFGACVPRPSNAKAHNRNITGEEQFARTFIDGRHPQNGINPVGKGPTAGIVAKFKTPVSIGSFLVERLKIPATAEFYVLKPGASFEAPAPGEVPSSDWLPLVRSDLARRINVVTAPQDGIVSEALYIRLLAQDGVGVNKWPRLTMCRILPNLVERVDVDATVQIPEAMEAADPVAGVIPGDLTWSFRSPVPMTEETPVPVLIDLNRTTEFDAMVLLRCVNQSYGIDEWIGGSAPPDVQDETNWRELTVHEAGNDRDGGNVAAITGSNDQRVSFDRTVSTRAVRLRMIEGMGASRWGNPARTVDPLRSEAADVAFVKLRGKRPEFAKMILKVLDGSTGNVLLESNDPSINMTAMAFDPSGLLYSIADGKLCVTSLPTAANSPVRHRVLHEAALKDPQSIGVSPDGKRIAVGDYGAHSVFVFDPTGKIETQIGGIGPRKKGPWSPLTVERPGAVTIDKLGKIWVCEKTFTPKRITRYSADGQFEKELLGPPHYGGGGAIDVDLSTFWYEAAEYEVDFAKGTTRLKNLNDVQADPSTPTLDGNTYTYTSVGRPIHHDGRRYIVSDVGRQQHPGLVISILDEGQTTWKPAAVLGPAQNSPFLTRADKPWRLHWLSQDLTNSSFIWCDLNGDGEYQVEEVQLFKNEDFGMKDSPFSGPYWGSKTAPDLTFWGPRARLAPSRFTDQGVPVYEKSKIQPFDYSALAPSTRLNNGSSMVARDGSMIRMGQPYLVNPDLTLKGGPVTATLDEFTPEIGGTILDSPLSFVGSADTKSPVGEVAMINGNNGRWFLWSVQDAVVLGEIFTGKKGGFGGITEAPRGLDITDNKQDWETFFGYFTAANDGNYYVIAGRGSFGLTRVEGIDEIQVASMPLTVTPDMLAENTKIRPNIVEIAANAKGPRRRPNLNLAPIKTRVPEFQADGDLTEWGDPEKFAKISKDGTLAFDVAWDADALTIAYRGVSATGNAGEDWRYVFKTGFAFDLMIRADGKQSAREVSPGDKRLVFAPHKGQWIAVLYDYVAAGADPQETVDYTSPVTSTRVDRVRLLPENAVRIAFRSDGNPENPDAAVPWTAEVQVAWQALGIKPVVGETITMDFGILTPDSGGFQVAKRSYWSDPDTEHVADLAVEAQIRPTNWGTLSITE